METTHATPQQTDQSNHNRTHFFAGIGLSVVLVAAAFLSGFQIGNGSSDGQGSANVFSFLSDAPEATESEPNLDEFWEVWRLMDEKFVASHEEDSVSVEERVQGAIKGLVASYDDPYTVFLPPQKAEDFASEISGNFSGVGFEIGMRDDMVTIIAPLADTPAERAGLLPGDVIVKIDDTDTAGMSIDDAVKMIRGEVGTTVTFTIYREGALDFEEISVERDIITIPTLDTEQQGDVFIISLYSFNALAEEKMEDAIREYQASGASKLVLDLRGNPGGFLQSAVSIAGHFLPAGKVVVRENFGDGTDEQVYRSSRQPVAGFAPEEVVILINQGSASASEILAGALREHGVATLIGEQSFGKGSVQELVSLDDGSSLKVTVARWLTPEGVSISLEGLAPDVEIERTPEQIIAGEDPQLEAALEFLNR